MKITEHKKQLHLRDFGYSTKIPSCFRLRAIRKACKVFGEEAVVEHMLKISNYHEQIKNDVTHIPYYMEQQILLREIEQIEAAYALIKVQNEYISVDASSRCSSRSSIEDEVYATQSIPLPELDIFPSTI